jgi:hypothetical protein
MKNDSLWHLGAGLALPLRLQCSLVARKQVLRTPLSDKVTDGGGSNKQEHCVMLSESRQNMWVLQTTEMAKHPLSWPVSESAAVLQLSI